MQRTFDRAIVFGVQWWFLRMGQVNGRWTRKDSCEIVPDAALCAADVVGDKAFFDQKRREAAEAENERILKEQEAMNSMTEEERAVRGVQHARFCLPCAAQVWHGGVFQAYLVARDRAREHEHKKNRMLAQQMAGYGSAGVKGAVRGGRGRGGVRGGKQRASVPVLPSEHIVSLEDGGEERNLDEDSFGEADFEDLVESGEVCV
jgi:hypothetical protein